jgi:amino acid transporter
MKRITKLLIGPPKDPTDSSVLRGLTLIAFFAWIGLGADGLSSSCYGPEEAYLALKDHTMLVWPLAALVAITVFIISASYSQVVGLFPAGGGGYIVGTRLLGATPGVISGASLIMDYVLTIAISCAAGVAAIFSFLPPGWAPLRLPAVFLAVLCMIGLNLRGVKESIKVFLPIFMAFVLTHAALIVLGLFHSGNFKSSYLQSADAIQVDAAKTGLWPLFLILMRAYSLGGGTFTGIEAVSNSMQILREPKVETARRTMVYMAFSLAFTAAGLLIAYQLSGIRPHEGKTLNAVLFQSILGTGTLGTLLLWTALAAEAGLLFVAAQAGYIGGPRTLATMAVDGWAPRQFSRLNDRLVVQNGVLVMGVAALVFVLLTRGEVRQLVVLYSVGVFITFILTQLGMFWHWLKSPKARGRVWGLISNGVGLLLTSTILSATVWINFGTGAWIGLVVIAGLVVGAHAIRRHYRRLQELLATLDRQMFGVDPGPKPETPRPLDSKAPTAILLVSGYNGLGIHALLTIFRMFPGQFRNVIFVSVAVVDYDRLHGEQEVDKLKRTTEEHLKRYVEFAHRAGFAADSRIALGTDPVEELSEICPALAREYNQCVVFGGQLAFAQETVFTRMLHSNVAFEIQRRLQFAGLPVVILPVRAVERK